MTCYVYIIQAGDKKGAPIKVGVSENPEKRLTQLQTGNPKVLRLLMTFECNDKHHAFKLEKTLHFMLRGQGILNEWFSCSRSKVTKMLNKISNDGGFDRIKNYDGMFSEQRSRARTRREAKLKDKQERKILALKNSLNKKRRSNSEWQCILSLKIKEMRSKQERRILRELLCWFGVEHGHIKQIYNHEIGSRADFIRDNVAKAREGLHIEGSDEDLIRVLIGGD